MTTQSHNNNSQVIFHCLPVLRDVIEPSSIDIDVKWFADGENILSQVLLWVTHSIPPSRPHRLEWTLLDKNQRS